MHIIAQVEIRTHCVIDAVEAVVMHQSEFIVNMRAVVEKYLSQCGRRFVELGSLFSYMKL